MQRKQVFGATAEYGLPLLVLIILLLYSYAIFLEMPYIGFDYNATDGEVLAAWGDNPAFLSLQPGDRILKVGELTWTAFLADNRLSLFDGRKPGDIVEIQVQRGDEQIVVPWILPGPNLVEIADRATALLPSYIFWLAGVLAISLVRPRDLRRQMLTAFFLLFAPWLIFGWISFSGFWYSRIIAPAITWLMLVAYLHLYWVFPRPLTQIPKFIVWMMYLAAGTMAALELLQLLPASIYVTAVMVALVASLIILVLHAIVQPDERRDLKVVAAATFLMVGAGVLLSSRASTLMNFRLELLWIAFLCLPALPVAYLYVINRRRLGGLELRANRIISVYLFSILIFFIFSVVVVIANAGTQIRGGRSWIQVASLAIAGVAAALLYPRFQSFIERRVLGIQVPSAQLLETYAARITTSLDTPSLVILLRDDILPSLLIRQSALLRMGEDGFITPLYTCLISDAQLPDRSEISTLLVKTGRYLSPPADQSRSERLGWVRLILPLQLGGRLIGLWLLGRRDPDDYYAQSEISILQAIANQTAIALVNIARADLLHALFQADIERQEEERAALARGLHDEVLNQMAAVFMRQPAAAGESISQETEEMIAGYLRDVISGLRPPMLNYGLQPAIEELVDHLCERVQGVPDFQINLTANGFRYDPHIEQHIFRIIQEACENVLQHAQARQVLIRGVLMPDYLYLAVEDDGLGFHAGKGLELAELLKLKHYGLAGMYERAAIIGAELEVHSRSGQGSCVEVSWKRRSEQAPSPDSADA